MCILHILAASGFLEVEETITNEKKRKKENSIWEDCESPSPNRNVTLRELVKLLVLWFAPREMVTRQGLLSRALMSAVSDLNPGHATC